MRLREVWSMPRPHSVWPCLTGSRVAGGVAWDSPTCTPPPFNLVTHKTHITSCNLHGRRCEVCQREGPQENVNFWRPSCGWAQTHACAGTIYGVSARSIIARVPSSMAHVEMSHYAVAHLLGHNYFDDTWATPTLPTFIPALFCWFIESKPHLVTCVR